MLHFSNVPVELEMTTSILHDKMWNVLVFVQFKYLSLKGPFDTGRTVKSNIIFIRMFMRTQPW